MNAGVQHGRWSPSWARWYRRALPAYWVFLFCCLHLPNPKLPGGVNWIDKLAHVVIFGLLAFLWWRVGESYRDPPDHRWVWKSALLLSAYAAVDEYLQQFVGRGTDWSDWLCNLVGIGVVLSLLEWRRRLGWNRAPRSPSI